MTILFEVEGFTRKIYIKSQSLRMTILFKVEGFTRKIDKVTGPQDDDFTVH